MPGKIVWENIAAGLKILNFPAAVGVAPLALPARALLLKLTEMLVFEASGIFAQLVVLVAAVFVLVKFW